MSQGADPTQQSQPLAAQQQASSTNLQIPNTDMSSFLAQLTPAQLNDLRQMLNTSATIPNTTVQSAQPVQQTLPIPEPVPASTGDDLEEGELGSTPEPMITEAEEPPIKSTRKHELASPPIEPLSKRRYKYALSANLSREAQIRRLEAVKASLHTMALTDNVRLEALKHDPLITDYGPLGYLYRSMSIFEQPQVTGQSATSNNATPSYQPLATTTTRTQPLDRQEYLARLQAAKNKKTEVPKGTVAEAATKPKKGLDPKKNELLKQKLAALKAEQAAAQAQKTTSGLAAGLSATPEADKFLASLTTSSQEGQSPIAHDPALVSGRSSVLSGLRNPVAADLTEPPTQADGRPFDLNARDHDKQRLIIDVSDEEESEFEDSDNGVAVPPSGNPLSTTTSNVPTPTTTNQQISAYEKKMQEIEAAKRQIAERERRAQSRSALATPLADTQAAYPFPAPTSTLGESNNGGLPGINVVNESQHPPPHIDTEMEGETVEDDEDFDDIYDNTETAATQTAPTTTADQQASDFEGWTGTEADSDSDTSMARDESEAAPNSFTRAADSTAITGLDGTVDVGPLAMAAAVLAAGAAIADTDIEDTEDFYEDSGPSGPSPPDVIVSESSSEDDELSDASMDMSAPEADSQDEDEDEDEELTTSNAKGSAISNNMTVKHTDFVQEAQPDAVPERNVAAKLGVKSVFTPYESPLASFKAYRHQHDQYKTAPGDVLSLTWTNKIDPMKPICPVETSGQTCHLKNCEYQHFADMALTSVEEVVRHLLYKNPPSYLGSECLRWAEAIRGLKLGEGEEAGDLASVARRCNEFRQRFTLGRGREWSSPIPSTTTNGLKRKDTSACSRSEVGEGDVLCSERRVAGG